MAPRPAEWHTSLDNVAPWPEAIKPWPPTLAEAMFLARYKALTGVVEDESWPPTLPVPWLRECGLVPNKP
jgi:hypothetical protein